MDDLHRFNSSLVPLHVPQLQEIFLQSPRKGCPPLHLRCKSLALLISLSPPALCFEYWVTRPCSLFHYLCVKTSRHHEEAVSNTCDCSIRLYSPIWSFIHLVVYPEGLRMFKCREPQCYGDLSLLPKEFADSAKKYLRNARWCCERCRQKLTHYGSTYEARISFDTFNNKDATDISFTLSSQHKNFVDTRLSRTFLCGMYTPYNVRMQRTPSVSFLNIHFSCQSVQAIDTVID